MSLLLTKPQHVLLIYTLDFSHKEINRLCACNCIYVVYGNCWVRAWTTEWTPVERTRSALGAQVKASVWPAGVEPGCTSLRPHLRADCHWGRISGWRSFSCGVFPVSLDLRRWVSTFPVACNTVPFVLPSLLLCSFIALLLHWPFWLLHVGSKNNGHRKGNL